MVSRIVKFAPLELINSFRANICLYAHENQQKYSSLEYFDQRLSMKQFYYEFVKGKLVAETMLKDKKIKIQFAFFENKVISRNIVFSSSFV